MFLREVSRSEIWRIANDRVSFRPFGEERVGADDVFVEVVERQGFSSINS